MISASKANEIAMNSDYQNQLTNAKIEIIESLIVKASERGEFEFNLSNAIYDDPFVSIDIGFNEIEILKSFGYKLKKNNNIPGFNWFINFLIDNDWIISWE